MILTLESDADTVELVKPEYIIRKPLNLTQAPWRSVRVDQPMANGEINRTSLLSAGTIGFGIRLVGDTATFTPRVDRLKRLTPASVTKTLIIDEQNGVPARQAELAELVVDVVAGLGTHQDLIVSARIPSGVWQSSLLKERAVLPVGSVASTGWNFNRVSNRFYGYEPFSGETSLMNAGTTVAYPTLKIFGPITSPSAVNVTTGESLTLDGLTILDGQFALVDMAAKTVVANGDGGSWVHYVDLTSSRWWGLVPGENVLQLGAVSAAPPAQMVVEWRDAWL